MRKNSKENKAQTVKQPEIKKENDAGKVLDSLMGNVDEVEKELEGEETAETAADFDPAAPMIKNRKIFFVVGLLVIVLSVVGLVTTIKAAVNMVNDIVNQTSLKNEFAEFIYPLVLIDTPAFDSTENIPSSVVINAAIWRIVINGNTDKYENDGQHMTISEIDVENSAAVLFGSSVKVEHQTISTGFDVFEYDSSLKSYVVPANFGKNTYWPKVSEISNVGDTFTLTVDYMTPIMGVGEEETSAIKQMIYTISRSASAKIVRSVQYVGGGNEW